jgi:hypothetical protein
MRLRGQPPPPPEPEAQFEELQASVLFCGRCRAPRPVRERLLLVLPDGELREYVCSACGESAGSRRLSRPPPEILLR